MLRVSNGIVVALNLLTLVVACSALGYCLWLNQKPQSPCEKTLRTPLLTVSAALIAVSAAGIVGAFCGVSFFMWLYLIMVFVLIVGLTAFTIFGIIVTHGRIGSVVGERRPEESSGWLRRHVVNENNWETIRACLAHVEFCRGIEAGKSEESYKHNLSPLKVGCCTAPSECPSVGGREGNYQRDCKLWSNKQTQLCYSCETCKAAVVGRIRNKWQTLAVINAFLVVLVVLVYFISCCAMRNIQKYGYTRFTNYESP